MNIAKWVSHPIVKDVIDRCEEDAPVRDILLTLSDHLNTIEDKFPGMSYAQILEGAANPHPQTVAFQLAQAGARRADIDLICASIGGKTPGGWHADDFRACDAQLAHRELVEMGYSSNRAHDIRRMRQDVSPLDHRIAKYVIDYGHTMEEAARHYDVNRYYIRISVGRVMYRRWLGLEDRAVL